MLKSKFIVLEGPDGSGQTTQASLLADALKKQGQSVFLTKEPADDLDGGVLRRILRNEIQVSPRTIQLYFTANRGNHLDNEIRPALDKGKIVISDRYFFSTFAFGMLNLGFNWLYEINSQFPMPDLTFYMDVSARVCVDRMQRRGGEQELFEKEETLEKVIENYKKVFAKNKFPNVFIIDGERDIGTIHKEVIGIVLARLK